jgi:mannose-6-phosphate isomerase-like protein (cupin superfamily)
MEITIPAGFSGPVPHAHDEFDEAIYVLNGRLQVVGDGEPEEAGAGGMFVAPRGHRHGFSNPFRQDALILGLWAPSEPAMAFMREIGAALTPDSPPDLDRMRAIYHRHASRLLP